MQAKRPVWNLSRSANHLRILSRHFRRISRTPRKEVEIKDPSNHVVLERSCPSRRLVVADLHVHPVRAQEEHCVRPGRAMFEVDGVIPVQVRAHRDTIRIARPHGARRVRRVEAEWIRVLAEAIDIRVRGEVRLHAQILRLKDEGVGRGGEQDFLRLGTEDAERERSGGVVEPDQRVGDRQVFPRRRARQNGLGNFITSLGWIGDL